MKDDVTMSLFAVRGLSRAGSQGKLHLGLQTFPCALGRGGRAPKAGEGDGVTPIGRWAVRQVLYRPDRGRRPQTLLPVSAIRPQMGWCDAPGDPNYNRMVAIPYPASHECLWRNDHLYDLLAVLSFNDRPRASGRGSAIFLHLAHRDYSPTQGCIALSRRHLERLLAAMRPADRIVIE
jgi:L,D-peptidoglycan transpeptidase YkuD (ErfK/YbiS/YcfS/YnhG family)